MQSIPRNGPASERDVFVSMDRVRLSDRVRAEQRHLQFFFLNLRFYSFTYFNFLAVVSLHCCTCAFSSCSRQGLLFVVVPGLFTAVVSLVVKHRLGIGKAPGLQ